jgi:PAS domain S-box-containing protein
MVLLNFLVLQILDAVGRIEAWIESSILDNEDSPLATSLGLVLALLFGLWRRYAVPLFRIEKDGAESGPLHRAEDLGHTDEYRFDLQGRLIEVPPGAENLVGSNREAMIGSLFSRFLLEKDVPPVIDGFIRVLRGESVADIGMHLRRGDGVVVPARMDLHPVLRGGEIKGVRGVLRASPLSSPALRKGDTRPGVSVYIFRKGKMLFVNPRFVESSGYGRGDLSSVDPMQIIHPADRSRVRRSNIGLLKGDPPSSCDFRIVTRDGRVRWVRARVRPVTYKGEKAILGNFVVMPAREEPVQGRGGRGNNRAASAHFGCSASA